MVEALVLVSANLNSTPDAYNKMFERATEAGKAHGAAAAAQVWGNDPYQGPQREAARPRVLQIIEDNIARFRHFDGSVAVRQLQSSDVPRSKRLTEIMLRLWSSRARTTTSTPEPTTTSGPRGFRTLGISSSPTRPIWSTSISRRSSIRPFWNSWVSFERNITAPLSLRFSLPFPSAYHSARKGR